MFEDMNWERILWQEWHHCNDPIYAQQLLFLLAGTKKSSFRSRRPTMVDLEAALQLASQANVRQGKPWRNLLRRLDKQRDTPPPVKNLLKAFKRQKHWTRSFIARHLLVQVGGEAVPDLVELAEDRSTTEATDLAETAVWLLENIALETTHRLESYAETYLCEDCLVSFEKCRASWGSLKSIDYYACRICGQSRRVVKPPTKAVAVLDENLRNHKVYKPDCIWVNVIRNNQLFECDRVEVLQATDRDVERFVMQVQNDTDLRRQAHYRAAPYFVATRARLSENSLRLLNDTFGTKLTRLE